MIVRLTCFFWDKKEITFSLGADNVTDILANENKVVILRDFYAPVIIHISKPELGINHPDNLCRWTASYF